MSALVQRAGLPRRKRAVLSRRCAFLTCPRRFEALEPRLLLAGDWQNPFNRFDVTGDDVAQPQDVLVGVNEQNARKLIGPQDQLPERSQHPEGPSSVSNQTLRAAELTPATDIPVPAAIKLAIGPKG